MNEENQESEVSAGFICALKFQVALAMVCFIIMLFAKFYVTINPPNNPKQTPNKVEEKTEVNKDIKDDNLVPVKDKDGNIIEYRTVNK